MKALAVGFPRFFLVRWLSQFLITCALVVWIGVPSVFGVENIATTTRRNLNNKELLSPLGPRCYIYTKHDDLVDWRAVEDHGRQAAQKGWKVEMVEFKASSHVGHMKADPERYWNVIRKPWETIKKEIQLGDSLSRL